MTPLAGRRVLVTRPREQAAELADRLTTLGADVLIAPLIRIAPPRDPEPLRRAVSEIGRFEWVVLTSANAADAFAHALRHAAIASPIPGRVCAIGPATAAQLAKHGLTADLVASASTAEGTVAAITAQGPIAERRVLLPKADIGRDYVATSLTARGAQVTEVVAYRTVAEANVPDDVRRALAGGHVDIVVFTSGSAVRSFASIFGDRTAAVLQRTAVAVIGPTTADAVRQLNVDVAIQPATYSVPALVDAIVSHHAK